MCNGGTKVMEKVESFYKEYEDLFEEYLDGSTPLPTYLF